MRFILLLILLLLVVGALPNWPYSAGWGILSQRLGCDSLNHIAAHSASLAIPQESPRALFKNIAEVTKNC
jgi:hypothetical protein